MPKFLIKDFNSYVISILFNIIAVTFLWVRNQRSDRWISLFFINVIFVQSLQLYEKYQTDLTTKNTCAIFLFLLLFIHPLINLVGGYIIKAEFAYIEQVGLYLMFLIYIFISKVGLGTLDFNNSINVDTNNTITWHFLNGINYYEWAFYIFSLLFSMYLYTSPQNITMMLGSYLLLFISFYNANYNFNATFPAFYNWLSFLIGAVIMY